MQFKDSHSSFMDEVDAIGYAEKFIQSIFEHFSALTPSLEIEMHNLVNPRHINNNKAEHVLDGVSYTLWYGELIIATANVRRTPNFNWSYATCHVIADNMQKIKTVQKDT